MKIRIVKQSINGFIEEVLYVSEIKETTERFIMKRFIDDEIIEVKKDGLFFFEVNGFFLKIKKGDKN